MIVQDLKYPFDHTIVYDVFNNDQVSSIIDEANIIASTYSSKELLIDNDKHHHKLLNDSKSLTFELISTKFGSGVIRKNALAAMQLYFANVIKKNAVTKFFNTTNGENTFLTLYKNGSSYYKHNDLSIITAAYIIDPIFEKGVTGGKMYFAEYDYMPHMQHNSCIIFPGHELHELTELKCSESYYKISITQFFYIDGHITKDTKHE